MADDRTAGANIIKKGIKQMDNNINLNGNDPTTQGQTEEQSGDLRQKIGSARVAAMRAGQQVRIQAEALADGLQSGLSERMSEKGQLGFSMFLYAVIAYGFFIFESSTAILLLIGFVALCEKDKNLIRMLVNVLALYLIIKIGWSLFSSLWAFATFALSKLLFFLPSVVFSFLSTTRTLIGYLYDFLFVLIGLHGVSKARKGEYIKVGYVDSLFD